MELVGLLDRSERSVQGQVGVSVVGVLGLDRLKSSSEKQCRLLVHSGLDSLRRLRTVWSHGPSAETLEDSSECRL